MKKIIFCDLDGTIVDTSRRIYHVHKESLRQLGVITPLFKEEYLTLKRKRISEEEIVGNFLSKSKKAAYLKKRLFLLEDPAFIKMDILFSFSLSTLKTLKKYHSLVLITKRKSKDLLLQQLQALHLSSFFKEVLAVEEKNISKKRLLQKYFWGSDLKADNLLVISIRKNAIIIGDTEEDILAGKEVGIPTIAVLSGMRNQENLKKYQPDFIVEDISEVVKERVLEKV